MFRYALLAGCAFAGSPACAADFINHAFSAEYDYPASGAPYASAQFSPILFTVGNGVETTADVEGVTTITVDFTATALTLSLATTLTNPTWNNVSFNGPVFTSASVIPFTHVALGAGTNLAGFDLSRVGLSDHAISVNWSGLTYTTGSTVELLFSGGVPEPASWMLMLGGFGLVGGAMRRRAERVSFGRALT